MKDVGIFIKVDDITLNRSKGKFARVCLNVDITKPLRGSLFLPVPNQPQPLEVPISYEGLHEVCAWCGSNAHVLDACPETPKGPLEVIVEKFGAAKIQPDNEPCLNQNPMSTPLAEKWVTVSPKKRGRSFPFARKKVSSKPSTSPAPPAVKIVSTVLSPLPAESVCPTLAGMGAPPSHHAIEDVVASADTPSPSMVNASVIGDPDTLAVTGLGSTALADPLPPAGYPIGAQARASPGNSQQHIPSPSSPLVGSPLEDEDVDMFLDLENDDAAQPSSESAKKRKLVPEEDSSSSFSTN